MSITEQQLAQSLQIIEEQLNIIKQALSEKGVTQSEGVVGIFDGEFMVEENGKKHQVPPNYASKSMLVPGDTVKMVVDAESGQSKFKQIGKAERLKAEGILVKKDGKFEVLTDAGSFKVLSAAIKHYNGEVGDKVKIQYPKNTHKGGWAAVVKVDSANEQPAIVDGPVLQPIISPVTEPTISASEATKVNGKADISTPQEAIQSTDSSTSAAQPKRTDSKPKPAKKPTPDKGERTASSPATTRVPQNQESLPTSSQPAPSASTEVHLDEDDLI